MTFNPLDQREILAENKDEVKKLLNTGFVKERTFTTLNEHKMPHFIDVMTSKDRECRLVVDNTKSRIVDVYVKRPKV